MRLTGASAAERDTWVSALVKQFLTGLGGAEDEFQRLKSAESALRDEITAFRAGDRIPRDNLHRRDVGSPGDRRATRRKTPR